MYWYIAFRGILCSDIKRVPDFLQQKYLPSLDGLRAFSVFYIIAFHWYLGWHMNGEKGWMIPGYLRSVLKEGILGVHFFFILSGFLITTLLLKERVNYQRISFRNFYLRRVFRILPIAVLYLLVTLLLNYWFDLGMQGRNFVFPLFFTENFDTYYHWNTTHYWSLSVEEQFYVIFPFIITLRMSRYWRVAVGLFLLTPVICYTFDHHYPGNNPAGYLLKIAYILMSKGLLSILTGTILAIVLFKYTFHTGINRYLFMGWQLLLLYLVLYFHKQQWIGDINHILSDACIALFLLSLLMRKDSFFYRVLNLPVMRWFGVLSYSIYIWQELFTAFQPWQGAFPLSGSMLFNLPLLLIVAWLSYTCFERPFLKLKERFTRREN